MLLIVGNEVLSARLNADTLNSGDCFEGSFAVEVRIRTKAINMVNSLDVTRS
jgi:hypothetical protein